jgi:hypothetical protein
MLILCAFGFFLGLSVYNPSTSVIKNKQSALIKPATIADKVSLSPNLISALDRESFSLMIGIAPKPSNSLIVCLVFVRVFS